MPTQNSTQTYEMLKTYLDETADSFEKLDEEPGFLYRKTDGRTRSFSAPAWIKSSAFCF